MKNLTSNGSGMGRAASSLYKKLEKAILSGQPRANDFLPTVRELCRRYHASASTVSHALKELQTKGLVVSEPKLGWRVLTNHVKSKAHVTYAYLSPDMPQDPGTFSRNFHSRLMAAFLRTSDQQDWGLLRVKLGDRSNADVAAHVESAGASGVMLDHADPELVNLFNKRNIPVVLVEARNENNLVLDSITQDGFGGAKLATDLLIRKGHKRIAWVGLEPTRGGHQIIERQAGAQAVLQQAGFNFSHEVRLPAPIDMDATLARIRKEIFASDDPPTAILALWIGATQAVMHTAHQAGLTAGKDFDLVGWSTEEEYEPRFVPIFDSSSVQPAVTWSIAQMTEAAVARLSQRCHQPDLKPIHLNIPTRLRMPGAKIVSTQ